MPMRELAVIGGGPAGLAAAATAAGLGVDTVLIDEQDTPGGQIYRGIGRSPLSDRGVLGADYWQGEPLVEAFYRSGATHHPATGAWMVDPGSGPDGAAEIGLSSGGRASIMHARTVIVATGAIERPLPIPGWTLPGVMTAGAAQILLKTSGLVPPERAVLAGSGPLLYLLAWQWLNAGVQVALLLDTTPRGRIAQALPHALDFLLSPYFGKGIDLLRRVRRAIPIVRQVEALEAQGRGALEAVTWRAGGVSASVAAPLLLLHQGVIPNVNLASAIGCRLQWNGQMRCWEPQVDDWGRSSVEGIAIAGDGAGIGGARAAEERGRLAALDAALRLGRIDEARRSREAGAVRRSLRRALRGRRFFEVLYEPSPEYLVPRGETIVCRCEEVTAAEVREVVRLGCSGPNQLKSFLRCGMGPCQGRYCGPTVTEIIADERRVSPAEVGYYRLRFPIKPLTLGELAALPVDSEAEQAVVRLPSAARH